MGVLRLSPNWIVARLAGVYVDVFRNIPVLLWILAFMAVMTDMRRRRPPSAATTPPPRCSSARSRSPTAASTSPGRSSAPGWQVVVGVFVALGDRDHRVFGRYAARRQEATGEILPDASGSSSALLVVPTLLADLLAGPPDQLRLPRAPALQLRGRRLHRQVAHRALAGALASTPPPSSPRTCAPASRRSRAARPRRPARSACGRPGDEPRGPAPGAAGDHPAADLAVPEPDQELLARHRGRLHGRRAPRSAASP